MAGEEQTRPQKKLQAEAEPESLEDILDGLEQKIERLKVLYDQYFMGIEKIEPQVFRKDVNRTIQNLAKIQIRNTGLRFRYRTLVQRFNVHVTHWSRILREIELGTYKRDVIRASRAMAAKGAELPEEIAAKLKPRDRERLRAEKEADLPVASERRAVDEDLPAPTPVLELEAEPPELELEAEPPEAVFEAEGPTAPRRGLQPRDDAELAAALASLDTAPWVGPGAKAPAAPAAEPPAPRAGAAPARPPTPPTGAAPARPPTPPTGAAPARPPTPPTGARRPPTPALGSASVTASASRAGAGAGGMSREQIEVLHRRLIQAKKLCGEATSGLTVEALAASLDKTAPKVMKEKGCREVEFTVVIKNDKAILKAIPKK
jgi:hypothetical protein